MTTPSIVLLLALTSTLAAQTTKLAHFHHIHLNATDPAAAAAFYPNHFGHLHLLSEDPVAAGEWYIEHFGAVTRRKPPYPRDERFYKGFQVAPLMSLMMDNVNIIIFPAGYARKAWPELWENRKSFEST